jgi:hypothetical protein
MLSNNRPPHCVTETETDQGSIVLEPSSLSSSILGKALTSTGSSSTSVPVLNPFQRPLTTGASTQRVRLVSDQIGCLLLTQPQASFWQWLPASQCSITFQSISADDKSTRGLKAVTPSWPTGSVLPPSLNTPNEAFYRGALPEVLILWLEPHQIGAFASGWSQWIESLSALGFLLESGSAGEQGLPAVHPTIVLMGDGLLYATLCNRLHWQLERLPLATQSPDVLRTQLVGSICRGVLDQGPMLRLAGQNKTVLRSVQSVFHRQCVPVSLCDAGPHTAQRLEMVQFTRHLLTQWLPQVAGTVKPKQLPQPLPTLAHSIRTTLLAVGQRRHSLFANDVPDALLPTKALVGEDKAFAPSPAHHASLQVLIGYLEQHRIPDTGRALAWLLAQSAE